MNIADLYRLIENLIRIASISDVDFSDPENPQCRCLVGEIKTNWLSVGHTRMGAVKEWNPPSVGEQVVLVSPSGDLSQAVIIAALSSIAHPSPDIDPKKPKRTYPDGAVIEYDYQAHKLSAILPTNATFELKSAGGLKVTGDLDLDGKLNVTGDIESGGNVKDINGSMQQMRDKYDAHGGHIGTGTPQPRMNTP
ncbi:phage baseplate assembly protein V [Agitococcus lubricus]|uniref:Phage baseplate assembly protein V n=1 Tax=Agitococcus lubricus TaxID=1077255 RepID=A0A2T5J1G2_9GAMM|nr:phage baseplate assembly protein V [Agitococcus lubricus]PTQ90282.1 phage baseplate assembly protein V [Agitococcus lubricus]